MAVGYNPSIVLDGLTFLMDAQSEKGFGADDFTKARTRIIDNPGDCNAGEDVIVKHSQGPFPGAGYVTFDGTNDYLDCGSNADFQFGTGDFTTECWVYPSSVTNTYASYLFGTYEYNGSDVGWSIYLNSSGKLGFYFAGSSTANSVSLVDPGSALTANTWYHLAATRSGNTLRLFLNGQLVASNSSVSTNANHSGELYIATASLNNISPVVGNSGASLDGYLSNVRIVKGTALYTSNFTPAGNSLTAVTNTKLLTCQGGSIVDASSSGHSITNNGATAVYPSLGSYVFDGNQNTRDQKIQFSSSLFNSNSNFTLSMWYEASNTGDIISNTTGAGLSVQLGTIVMIQEPYGGGQLTLTSSVVTFNQIYNVVITRNGQTTTSFSVFVNGEEVSVSNNNNGGAEIFSYHPNVIGSRYNGGNTPAAHFQGKLYHMCAYQRVLTDSEIKQNFNALRRRYGI